MNKKDRIEFVRAGLAGYARLNDRSKERTSKETWICECHDGRFGPASPNCPDCRGTGMQRLYSGDFITNKRAEIERRVTLAKKLCQAQVRNPQIVRQPGKP